MNKFRPLDPVLHSQLRLAVISILMNTETAEFTFIREQTGATAGNLSVQINKLKDEGYITVEKRFHKNYPQTICRISPLGRKRFEEYVSNLADYIGDKKDQS
jgi:DNA-binding MarR family transcriptional regulator